MKKLSIIFMTCFLVACTSKRQEKEVDIEDYEDITISGTYYEDVEDYATSLSFSSEKTFEANVNVCHGMVEVKGTYNIQDNKIFLYFPKSTGFDFIDDKQPYIFNIQDDKLSLFMGSESLSCGGNNTFIKEEE